MTTYAPGELPPSALVEVEKGIQVSTITARAYRRVKVAFKNKGKSLRIVDNTSGYRSASVQHAMHIAGSSSGTAAERLRYNLNPNSSVPIADHPYGTHEDGRCVDILVNGSSTIGASDRALLKEYGFLWQFGEADPNHFRHDNKTQIKPVSRAWCVTNGLYVGPLAPTVTTDQKNVKKVATYLNKRKLGRVTGASSTGVRGQNYWWLMQAAGMKDKLYPVPPYVHDGVAGSGTKTASLEKHYLSVA